MTPVKPMRMRPKQAAELLNIGIQTLYAMMREERFTCVRNGPAAPGRPVYLLTEELEAHARGDEAELARLRKQNAPAARAKKRA
jgi:hypothetical protein